MRVYSTPDIIKVALNVRDVFSNGYVTGCPEDEMGEWKYTKPCEGTPEYYFDGYTFTGAGLSHMCYSEFNQ